MAKVIVGSYAVRFPVGGYLSWVLQWLVGFQRLGHEVFFVEKSGWPDACFDPSTDVMSDDCSYGVRALEATLAPFGLDRSWCFVDVAGRYHGMERTRIEQVFESAGLFVDMGTHGSWLPEARRTGVRILVDGDPGYTQMRAHIEKEDLGGYDHYYSVGRNVGTERSMVPTLGKQWRPLFDPVVMDLFTCPPADSRAAFTTVMAWQTYRALDFGGRIYGQKDLEFRRFFDLPRRTSVPLEVAVGGEHVPTGEMVKAGWSVENPLARTKSVQTFHDYIASSRGEFSVCKNIYVDTNSGFFSDRSAAYLASARPVVMQDTGLDGHLPSGNGFFAVRTVEEAAAALDEIDANYGRHSTAARELAAGLLDTRKVLGALLTEVGVRGTTREPPDVFCYSEPLGAGRIRRPGLPGFPALAVAREGRPGPGVVGFQVDGS